VPDLPAPTHLSIPNLSGGRRAVDLNTQLSLIFANEADAAEQEAALLAHVLPIAKALDFRGRSGS
jgi:hypothetical protein